MRASRKKYGRPHRKHTPTPNKTYQKILMNRLRVDRVRVRREVELRKVYKKRLQRFF